MNFSISPTLYGFLWDVAWVFEETPRRFSFAGAGVPIPIKILLSGSVY